MLLVRLSVLLVLFSQPGWAMEPNCTSQSDLQSSGEDLFASSCVPTCTALMKVETEKAKKYFEKNCRSFSADQNRPFSFSDLGKKTVNVLDKALLQCLPRAGKKAVVGVYEFAKALPGMISYLLSAPPSNPNASGPSASEQWLACSKSDVCRRALARNTLRFQEMKPDGTYKVSDAEVDAAISKMSFNDLHIQAQHDQQLSKNECLGYLGSLRKEVSSDGEDWTLARHQKVYDTLSKTHPHCPGALKILPPKLEAKPEVENLESCLKKSPNPIECLSLQEKIAVGTVCLGKDFTDPWEEIQVEFCADVVQVIAPVPVIGPQSKFFALTEGPAVAAKGAAAAAASESAEKVAIDQVAAGAKGEMRPVVPRTTEVRNFVEEYKSTVYASEAQNLRYMAVANGASDGKTVFFDVENSVMKKLNDSTNDKDLVTGLTNFQKETFLKKVEGLRAKYPDLQLELYSDFKSVKIAAKGKTQMSPERQAQLLKDLNQIYVESNKEFAMKVKKMGISVPEVGDPEKWFRAGSGRSVDEAALAARRARQEDGPLQALDYSSKEVREKMTAKLGQVETDRLALVNAPEFRPLMEKSPQGITLPRQDVFDLVRKHESPQALAKAVSDRYGVAFGVDDAKKLQGYVKGVDEFSPTILIAKRETVNMDEALAGGASADFLGLGSANLKATAEGIANPTNLEKALSGARTGEVKVTQVFKARIEKFKKVVGGNVVCSGDDCVRLASTALSDKEKTRILKDLAKDPQTRQVRMSFIGPGVAPEARMQLASHGESIEKAFRKELEGRISHSKLSTMTFGFDMKTATLNQGSVNLIVGKNATTRLSAKEQIEMQQAFARALEKYNKDVRAYTQGTSRTSELQLRLVPGGGLIGLQDSE